jgi:hypothetical protein
MPTQEELVAQLKAQIARRDAGKAAALAEAKAAAAGTDKEPFDADMFREIYQRLNPYDKYIPWDTLLKEAEHDYYVKAKDKKTLEDFVKYMNWLDGFA